MTLQVVTKGLKESSDELGKAEKNIIKSCEEIEEALKRLRRSDDDAKRELSKKLAGTLEKIREDLFALAMVKISLIKAAELYSRTEERVQRFEDRAFESKPEELKEQNIEKIKEKTSETFEKL